MRRRRKLVLAKTMEKAVNSFMEHRASQKRIEWWKPSNDATAWRFAVLIMLYEWYNYTGDFDLSGLGFFAAVKLAVRAVLVLVSIVGLVDGLVTYYNNIIKSCVDEKKKLVRKIRKKCETDYNNARAALHAQTPAMKHETQRLVFQRMGDFREFDEFEFGKQEFDAFWKRHGPKVKAGLIKESTRQIKTDFFNSVKFARCERGYKDICICDNFEQAMRVLECV